MTKPTDPAAILLDLFLQSGRGKGGGSGAGADGAGGDGAESGGFQTGFAPMIERALSAANVATGSDVTALSERLERVEAALFRIEAALGTLGGKPVAADAGDEPAKPKKSRKH